MIFGRKKKAAVPASPATADPVDEVEPEDDSTEEPDDTDGDVDGPGEEPDDSTDDDSSAGEESDDWDDYEASRDWREDGPFDIDEVDLTGDEVDRLDLGSLIITPEEGMQLQIVADSQTGEGMALIAALESSALQIELRAAPSSGGFAKELRGDIEAETTQAGGSCELAKGPFGIELRRLLPATDQEGSEGVAPLRDWFAEGPRWLLIGRLMGEAALDVEGEGASLAMEEFFGNLVVRRGAEAMAAGQTVPLTIPQG